jgi:hypothetical protein
MTRCGHSPINFAVVHNAVSAPRRCVKFWFSPAGSTDQHPFTGVEIGGRISILGDFAMQKHVLVVATSAFILAYGVLGAIAQGPVTATPSQQTGQQQAMPMGQGCGMMGQRGMMGRGMMGGGHPVMMRMIFALIVSDGDGTIELPEFQAAHERIFKAMDSNKDGHLTLEEMQAFMQGAIPH